MLSFLISIPSSYATSSNVSSTASGYSISILDSSLGGNVKANPEISSNIPKTNLSNQIFKMTKQGSVVLKFGDSNGPKLLISAGIHGNEPEANIAVMKFLEYIKYKHISGTLYVIPFDIPKDTALNSRLYKGYDPNRVASKPGTPGWNIVQFAKKNGVQYLLDVHSGSEVGNKGFIFVNKVSTSQERNWVSYIGSKTGCGSSVNGVDNSGMIRFFAHSKGIHSITVEVERDAIPTKVAAETEYKIIMAATQKFIFDTTPPLIIKTDPANNQFNVAPNKLIRLTFNEAIKAGKNYWIELKDGRGSPVYFTKSINGKILIINPLKNLTNSHYTLLIHTGAVTDLSGNPVAARELKFTVKMPTVTRTNPSSGATKIARNKVMTVSFSENIKAASNCRIELKSSNGTLVKINKSINSRILTISHNALLMANTKYTLILYTGSVIDLLGHPCNFIAFSFTTGTI